MIFSFLDHLCSYIHYNPRIISSQSRKVTDLSHFLNCPVDAMVCSVLPIFFRFVQARRSSLARGRKTLTTGFTHPPSGFLICTDCGCKMNRSSRKHGNKRFFFCAANPINNKKVYEPTAHTLFYASLFPACPLFAMSIRIVLLPRTRANSPTGRAHSFTSRAACRSPACTCWTSRRTAFPRCGRSNCATFWKTRRGFSGASS